MIKWLKEFYGKASPGNVHYPSDKNWTTGFDKPEGNQELNKIYHRFYKGKNTQLQIFYKLPNIKSNEFFELLDISLSNNSDKIKNSLEKDFSNDFKNIKLSTITSPIKNLLEVNVILKKEDRISELINAVTKILSETNFSLLKEVVETEAIKSVTSFYKNTEKPHMFGIFNAGQLAEFGIESILNSYRGDGYSSAAKKLTKLNFSKIYTSIVEHPFTTEVKNENKNSTNVKLFSATKNKPALIVKQAEGSNLLAIHYLLKYKSAFESKYGKNAALIWHDAFGQRMKSTEVKKKSVKFGFSYTVNDNPYIPMDNIYLDPAFGYIRVEGLASDVKEAIKFLNNQFINFIPTKKEFEKAKKKLSMIAMMARGNKAKKLFNSIIDKVIYKPGNFSDNKKELTYENLLFFGKDYFNPSNMIISVVSPESPENIEKYFNDFTLKIASQIYSGPGYKKEFNNFTNQVKIDTNGAGAQAYLYYGFQKIININEKPALLALSLLLRNDIIFNIREKQGLAYRMSAGVSTIGDKAMFYINMGTRPDNSEKLIPQFPSFFITDFADRITGEKLKKSVNMFLGRMMFRRLSSINQAYYLAHSLYFYNDINYDSRFLSALKKVTLSEVKAVAEKYLKVENPVEIFVR